MQKYEYKGAIAPIDVEIMYQSKYYTVARASTKIVSNQTEKVVFAEGVSRRSFLDVFTGKGKDIASGRAKKALSIKLNGRHIYIHKAKDLLMNC